MASHLTPYANLSKPTSSSSPPKSISPLYTLGGKVRINPLTVVEEYYNDILISCKEYYKFMSETKENKDKVKIKETKKECQSIINNTFTYLQLDTTIIDAEFVLSDIDSIIDTNGEFVVQLLDAGIDKIIIDIPTTESSTTAPNYDELKNILDKLPRNRLGIHYPSIEYIYEHQDLLPLVEKVSISYNRLDDCNIFWDLLSDVQDCMTHGNTLTVCVSSISDDTMNVVSSLAAGIFSKKINACLALANPTAMQLGECYAACIKCERKDGLFTTVVCTRDGHSLGLVYSSKESIIKALETGRGVYYSRSRQSLWKKGDTSGDYQTLHRIDIDCDRDAILFTVTQHGLPTPSFCHLKTLSCWGELRGIDHLQRTLQSRLHANEPGSYTQRLFNDDELLKQKLIEESLELIEAKTKQHVAEELADVMYFALVKATKHGVTMEDAVRELEKRSKKITRRKGDSKKERIDEGKQVLETIGK